MCDNSNFGSACLESPLRNPQQDHAPTYSAHLNVACSNLKDTCHICELIVVACSHVFGGKSRSTGSLKRPPGWVSVPADNCLL